MPSKCSTYTTYNIFRQIEYVATSLDMLWPWGWVIILFTLEIDLIWNSEETVPCGITSALQKSNFYCYRKWFEVGTSVLNKSNQIGSQSWVPSLAVKVIHSPNWLLLKIKYQKIVAKTGALPNRITTDDVQTCQAVTAVRHLSVDLSATKVAGSIPHKATLFLLTPGT
jgi:hypothetical protein